MDTVVLRVTVWGKVRSTSSVIVYHQRQYTSRPQDKKKDSVVCSLIKFLGKTWNLCRERKLLSRSVAGLSRQRDFLFIDRRVKRLGKRRRQAHTSSLPTTSSPIKCYYYPGVQKQRPKRGYIV